MNWFKRAKQILPQEMNDHLFGALKQIPGEWVRKQQRDFGSPDDRWAGYLVIAASNIFQPNDQGGIQVSWKAPYTGHIDSRIGHNKLEFMVEVNYAKSQDEEKGRLRADEGAIEYLSPQYAEQFSPFSNYKETPKAVGQQEIETPFDVAEFAEYALNYLYNKTDSDEGDDDIDMKPEPTGGSEVLVPSLVDAL